MRGKANLRLVTNEVKVIDEVQVLASHQVDILSVLELSSTNLGALRVQQDGTHSLGLGYCGRRRSVSCGVIL